MRVELEFTVDVVSAIEEAVSNVGLTGLGADGDSEYSVVDVDVDAEVIVVKVGVEIERESGKFVSKDEITESIESELDEINVALQ